MSIVKIIEVLGTSEKSWEDAVEQALERAGKTVKNIVGVDVIGFKGKVENNRIVEYRADVKIAFVVED